jgi:TolB protein
MLAHGVHGTASQIPWSEVGDGWTLATWGKGAFGTSIAPTLFLVDPLGGRYAVMTMPLNTSLVDWSGDLQRALLEGGSTSAETVTEIDLRTGATLHQFTLSGVGDVSYTLPKGLALVEQGSMQGSMQVNGTMNYPGLRRIGLDGSPELTFPSQFSKVGHYTGQYLYSPDGTDIAMGASKGIAIVSNNGSVIKQFPEPGDCMPLMWTWPSSLPLSYWIQSSCAVPTATSENSIWQFPVTGTSSGTPEEMPTKGPVVNVWYAGGAAYAQNEVCGDHWISDPVTGVEIKIPGLATGMGTSIEGVSGQNLEVLIAPTCGGTHQNPYLAFFNPMTRTVTPLLGGPLNGGAVYDSIPYKVEI